MYSQLSLVTNIRIMQVEVIELEGIGLTLGQLGEKIRSASPT